MREKWRQEDGRLDHHEIAFDLQTDPMFSENCWHMSRLFHRCRRMAGTEAPAESWFSILKNIYDPRAGGHIGSIAEQLHLRAAGIRGSGADDCIVHRIVDSVLAKDGTVRKSSAMQHFIGEEDENWKKRPLSAVVPDLKQEPVPERGHKLRRVLQKSKEAVEPIFLEEETKVLLEQFGDGLWRMPLYASTQKQWASDLKHETRQSERALAWQKGRGS